MNKKKKRENGDETIEIITKILDYNNEAQNLFQRASKVDKRKSKPKTQESIAERTILRKGMVAETEEEDKRINNELLKKYFNNYQSPSDIYKILRKTEGKKMKIKYMESEKC